MTCGVVVVVIVAYKEIFYSIHNTHNIYSCTTHRKSTETTQHMLMTMMRLWHRDIERHADNDEFIRNIRIFSCRTMCHDHVCVCVFAGDLNNRTLKLSVVITAATPAKCASFACDNATQRRDTIEGTFTISRWKMVHTNRSFHNTVVLAFHPDMRSLHKAYGVVLRTGATVT